jgi:hypothetical protein
MQQQAVRGFVPSDYGNSSVRGGPLNMGLTVIPGVVKRRLTEFSISPHGYNSKNLCARKQNRLRVT